MALPFFVFSTASARSKVVARGLGGLNLELLRWG
jgi:hypothetical protein